jgi:hypothetical protein
MPVAYIRAASMLLEGMISLASKRPGSANALLPPYLFLWRHSFEMQLKRILKEVSDELHRWNAATAQNVAPDVYSGVNKTHSLLSLWQRVEPFAETVLAREPHAWRPRRMSLSDVSGLLGQLHNIDPAGDGVRYETDRNGRPTMLGVNRVDLEHSESNMQGIAEFLHWTYLEIGATMGVLPSEAEAEKQR